MARYHHYRNSDEPGQTMFITTTVLDFVHAFRRGEPRHAMVLAIANECKRARARLHAYVVMPHHIHIVVSLYEHMTVFRFMNILKRESSRAVKPLLNDKELKEFAEQSGLNGNSFWQRSFRSIAIEGDEMFWSKVNYIHMNPVRAGLVEQPADYLCSSARLLADGRWSGERGLALDAVADSLTPGTCSDWKTEMCAA